MPVCTSLPLEDTLRTIFAADCSKEPVVLSVASVHIQVWIGVAKENMIMLQGQPFLFFLGFGRRRLDCFPHKPTASFLHPIHVGVREKKKE
jgi:hypothetical protein